MTPTKLTVKGFLRFFEETAVDFTQFKAASVTGANGTGKSSICIDTILFALFGKARVRDCLNVLADEGCVELSFKHKGQDYTVKRTLIRDKGQKLLIKQGDKDLTERLLSKTQDKLDSILGFTESLLRATCLSVQDQVNFFSDLSSPERANILMELLDLKVWEKKKDLAQAWCLQHKGVGEERGQAETQINLLEQALREDTEKLKDFEAHKIDGILQLELAERDEKHIALELAMNAGEYRAIAKEAVSLVQQIQGKKKHLRSQTMSLEDISKEIDS